MSNSPIWPLSAADGDNNAEVECLKMGLPLAEVSSGDEETALHEVSRCKMASIIGDRPLLVGGSGGLCKFQLKDGSYANSDVSTYLLRR